MLEKAGATFVKLTKIQAWQELVFVLSAFSNIVNREKASKLSFWWSDDNSWKNMQYCGVLHRAINYIIERFAYFLEFHSSNYNNDKNGLLYSAHVCHSVIFLALNHYYPGFSLAAIMALEHYKE